LAFAASPDKNRKFECLGQIEGKDENRKTECCTPIEGIHENNAAERCGEKMTEIDGMLEFLTHQAQKAIEAEKRNRAEAHVYANGSEQELLDRMAPAKVPTADVRKLLARKLRAIANQNKAEAEMFKAIGAKLAQRCGRRQNSRIRMLGTDKRNSRN
jgi:hypothetical protein